MTDSRGFTLVEVMVTLVLISILAAGASLAMRPTLPPVPLPGEAEVRVAREHAIMTGKIVTVRCQDGSCGPVLFLSDGRPLEYVAQSDSITPILAEGVDP